MMCLSYCGYMIIFSWLSNNIPRPPAKRAVALAFVNGFSQIGNLAGSPVLICISQFHSSHSPCHPLTNAQLCCIRYCFPVNWGPTYRKSFGICIALQGLTIIMCWTFWRYLKMQNGLLERKERERGQRVKGFRYIL